ncbi:MAG: DEAD/DEAH box helicase [Coriobacteriia bacterium]|nr:DEAD/DEAH box helicase [Coriobacteriia bacterium]
MRFSDLGLDPTILAGVEALGFETPTPIQAEALPFALEGRDVVGCAQTGTGKTAAFILPALQRTPADGVLRTLVVSPTRELAQQIELFTREMGKATGHKVVSAVGGVGYETQVKALKAGVEVLVATPGRLLDLVKRGDAKLGKVEILVLDEADRMLDMGFWPDVRRILAELPKQRQTMLFSATMAPEILRLVEKNLSDPVRVDVAPSGTPIEAIHQALYPVDSSQKVDLLVALMEAHGDFDRTLVFCGTKQRSDAVAMGLERAGIPTLTMHSDRSQEQRQKALEKFRAGKVRVLVATDVVSRGIDVEGISHVVNYDVPSHPEDYVHRIGRTARAGTDGTAFTLVTITEFPELDAIEMLIDTEIPVEHLEGFPYRERAIPMAGRLAARKKRKAFGGRVMGRGGRRR